MLTMTQTQLDALGYDLAAAVRDYQAALADHALTVDVPAPVAPALVEQIVRHHGGQYRVEPDPVPASPAPSQTDAPALAGAALLASDLTVLRCCEAGVPVPEAWRQYRVSLRAIVSGIVAALPPRPDYPPETGP